VDLRAITYIGTVDENLMCPICRCALIEPITTKCDHTFCRECIDNSLSLNEICPVDRSPMARNVPLTKSPKIVTNQLDNLKVKCPCCENTVPRSMLKHHLEKYCVEAPVVCPGKYTERYCHQNVKRKYAEKGCMHYLTECPDCLGALFQIEMEEHREFSCRQRQSHCDLCGAEILRCEISEHDKECPEKVVSCKWDEYGCEHKAKRVDLQNHTTECKFKLVGPLADTLKKEINALRTELKTLTETNHLQERRIKFLEKGSQSAERLLDYSDFSGHALDPLTRPGDEGSLDSAHEYLLSLLEAQESKVSQLSADMTELDSKQTVLLFNETIPIKNELAELRSNLQVTSMHVRWLMRFRIQENQRRGGGIVPGPAGGTDAGGASSDSVLPRRLSDSVREIITKL